MFRTVLFAGCIAASAAFTGQLSSIGNHAQLRSKAVSLRPGARATSALNMQLEAKTPVNIFEGMDADGQDVKNSAFLQESEIKHGRLAMLAAVGWPVAELLHPILAQASNFPSLLTDAGQVPSVLNGGLDKIADSPGGLFFLLFAFGRAFSLETGALRPRNNFLSKEPKEMYPYDLGFDPLGFYAKATPEQRKVMAEKELNNGRLAMIAMTLYPIIEFASKAPLVSMGTGSE
mmetsp:Transcript_87293/g.127684  ORF Transcript_87293/g.127684 Transcript_87293/m.127684 type:complete len:232 (-) Transcript_87293:76-771(-)